MATTHRSDLVDEIEKALRDEAYDGGFGYMGAEQFTAYVRTLAVTAAKVVEGAHTPTDDEWKISEAISRAAVRGVEFMDQGAGPGDAISLSDIFLSGFASAIDAVREELRAASGVGGEGR